jgi:rhamnose utilization protein RhaD (predicted bifunctional aldolase and dehydrogenase)/NAD(P)-dependent dehydrogenase (short-subunit alcohol dehydrogenase family)
VKGSVWDLDSIEPAGLPAMALAPLRALRRLDSLSDEEMVNQQRINLFDATAPNPSVETLLHAFLPHTFIDHTHADAILALTNQRGGEALVREALGEGLVIVPYVMPGFQLAKLAAELFEKRPDALGMVLMKHGLFTFAADARTSYERTIDLVDRAERFLAARSAPIPRAASRDRAASLREAAHVAPLLRGLLAGRSADRDQPFRRVILEHRATDEVLDALSDPACESLAKRGPLTPDHVIRTKASPLYVPSPRLDDPAALRAQLGEAIASFRRSYDEYFARQTAEKGVQRTKLDPDPCVVLLPGVGLFGVGKTRKDAAIAADISEHTLRIKALGERLVTGAAGAIGVGIGLELARAGAHVVLTDVDEKGLEKARERIAKVAGSLGCVACRMDVTDEVSVAAGFALACRTFGGVDIVVPNAGIAHVSPLADTEARAFERVIDVNLGGYFLTMREAARVFRAQGTGGNIVINASKNVFGPGADFGAYSASKAAGHQLGKVAAIELAPLGVRVNMINADAVFSEGETPSGL